MTDSNTNENGEKKPIKEELSDADAVNAEVDLDDSKAKFLNGGKGIDEPHVVVEVASSGDGSFTGLGKEDLMQYVNDPFWKRLRIILFVLFWVGWAAMLVAAIVIIVLAPRCPYRPDLKWYHKEAVYSVYPKSFKDSNGDGVGDIAGIKSKAEYITSLGAKTISFGSIFKKDDGNGVVDFKDVDPVLGSLKEMTDLLTKYKKTGPKVILDFVPNHTSDKHKWFVESRKSKDNKYAGYYVWRDVNNGGAPNDWKGVGSNAQNSAWEYDNTRDQYYLCMKGREYPDLNLVNEEVMTELQDVLKFWLEKGVGGFNLMDVDILHQSENDTSSSGTTHNQYNIDVMRAFRRVVDQFSDKPGRERVLMAVISGSTDNNTMEYYGTKEEPGVHIVIRETLAKLSRSCGAVCVKNLLEEELSGDLVSKWLGWMLGNEYTSRIGQKMGDDRDIGVHVLQMMLPGTPKMYYGDEVGMKDGTFDTSSVPNVTTDTYERSMLVYRTPMQWEPTEYAGFSSAEPYLPVNNGYMSNNVASEEAHFRAKSTLNKVKALLKLRSEESIQFGKITTGIVGEMFWFVRQAVGFDGYLVAINFGSGPVSHKFSNKDESTLFTKKAKVVFHSRIDYEDAGDIDISATYIELEAGDAIVLKLIPSE